MVGRTNSEVLRCIHGSQRAFADNVYCIVQYSTGLYCTVLYYWWRLCKTLSLNLHHWGFRYSIKKIRSTAHQSQKWLQEKIIGLRKKSHPLTGIMQIASFEFWYLIECGMDVTDLKEFTHLDITHSSTVCKHLSPNIFCHSGERIYLHQ